jgi:hypothetical protein
VRAEQVAGMVVDGRACPNDIPHVVDEGSHFAGMNVNVLSWWTLCDHVMWEISTLDRRDILAVSNAHHRACMAYA